MGKTAGAARYAAQVLLHVIACCLAGGEKIRIFAVVDTPIPLTRRHNFNYVFFGCQG